MLERHALFHEELADTRDTPLDGVLAERLVDNIRIARHHVGAQVRPVPVTPHLDVEDEADRDFLAVGPRFDVNRFSRQPG